MINRHSLRSASLALTSIIGAGVCFDSRSHAAPPATSARAASTLATMTAPDSPSLPPAFETPTKYPWKKNIVGTVFWVGELPTQNNPTPNTGSSWDPKWMQSFGGYDDPAIAARHAAFRPANFVPKENPFYVALPYNDVINYKTTKPEASKIIPWYKNTFVREGKSVCHNRWIAIRFQDRVCYAQWSDCGPFNTIDANYVFGDARPMNAKNQGAGIDLAPAVRDYLGFRSGQKCDWRFVEESEVPAGPWRDYGTNNPFSLAYAQKAANLPSLASAKANSVKLKSEALRPKVHTASEAEISRIEELRRQRDLWFSQNSRTK